MPKMRMKNLSLGKPVYSAGIASRKASTYIAASVAIFLGCLAMTPLLLSYNLDAIGWFALIVGPFAGLGGVLRSTVYRVSFFEEGFVHRNMIGLSREYPYEEIREVIEGDGYIVLHMRDSRKIKIYGVEGDPDVIGALLQRRGVALASTS